MIINLESDPNLKSEPFTINRPLSFWNNLVNECEKAIIHLDGKVDCDQRELGLGLKAYATRFSRMLAHHTDDVLEVRSYGGDDFLNLTLDTVELISEMLISPDKISTLMEFVEDGDRQIIDKDELQQNMLNQWKKSDSPVHKMLYKNLTSPPWKRNHKLEDFE